MMKSGMVMLALCLAAVALAGCSSEREAKSQGDVVLRLATHDQVGEVKFHFLRIDGASVLGKTDVFRTKPGSYDIEVEASSQKFGQEWRCYHRAIVDVPTEGEYVMHVTRIAPQTTNSFTEKVK